MIAYLSGTVLELEGLIAVINVGGVGYEVVCTRTAAALLVVGQHTALTTFTEVREDSLRLFGFSSKLEKQTFLLLTLVKGIGPKSALDVVSRIEAKELKLIARGDLVTLKGVKGIGQKTAERIIVELRDKVAEFILDQRSDRESLGDEKAGLSTMPQAAPVFEDAKLALLALGFARKEVETAMNTLQHQQQAGVQMGDSGVIVREALKLL